MKALIKLILLIIIGIPVIAVALANRQFVTFSLDPFGGSEPIAGLSLPLFLLLFAALVIGVLLGGIATWVGQGKHRRAARAARAEAQQLRAQQLPGQQIAS